MEAWGERRFSRDVEDRRFIRSHSLELQGYSVDTSKPVSAVWSVATSNRKWVGKGKLC